MLYMFLEMIFYFTIACASAAALYIVAKIMCKHWQVGASVFIVAILLAMFTMLPGALADEERTVWVTQFLFAESKVEVIDEDGFFHKVEFQPMDYYVGEEFTLHIEGEKLWLEEV